MKFDAAQAYAEDAHLVRRYLVQRGLVRAPEDVDDLVSATYERAIRSAHRYHEEGTRCAWLQRIARNLAIDAMRRVPVEVGELPATLSVGWEDPAMLLDLEDAVRRLPERHRRYIQLRYGEDYSRRETAQRMGISDAAAAALQKRALARLSRILGEP